MDESLDNLIEKIEDSLLFKTQLEEVKVMSDAISKATKIIDKSWSQSTLGTHATLYYGDFDEPPFNERFDVEWGLAHGMPPGWHNRTEDEVKSKLIKLSGLSISIDEFLDKSDEIKKSIEDYHQEILTILEIIDIPQELNLNWIKIKEFSLGDWSEGLHSKIQGSMVTRDMQAISSGRRIPVQTSMGYFARYSSQLKEKFVDLINLTKRLSQQLKLIDKKPQNPSSSSVEMQQLLEHMKTLNLSHQDLISKLASSSSADELSDSFFSNTKISQIEALGLQGYGLDLSKLVQLLREMNFAYGNDSYLSCIMIGRTIINHIPPIFGHKNFTEVANSRTKSVKQNFLNLQNSLKNIADHHLHDTAKAQDSLPCKQQINFVQDFDVVLAQIIIEVQKSIANSKAASTN